MMPYWINHCDLELWTLVLSTIFVPCFGIGEWLWHWSKLPVSVVQGYWVSQVPEIINCSNYSGDHMIKENLQQIHKMDQNKIICINLFWNSSSTHLSGPVGYKSWQYCHKELYSTKTRCIPQECSLTQYHAGKSQWGIWRYLEWKWFKVCRYRDSAQWNERSFQQGCTGANHTTGGKACCQIKTTWLNAKPTSLHKCVKSGVFLKWVND